MDSKSGMHAALVKYLSKSGLLQRWPIASPLDMSDIGCVVVIPILAEENALFDTLDALMQCDRHSLAAALVICVVNNRPPGMAEEKDVLENAKTLKRLHAMSSSSGAGSLRIAVVDAASPGNELPKKEGVGLARRIGADHGLALLHNQDKTAAPIVHLDADARPAPDYLKHLLHFYEQPNRWGAYAAYAHPVDNALTPEAQHAITDYECYLRYHELALRWAGSPYAHPALGSIMSSTAQAYAAVGGMPRRLAGEDFYFLQQLAKTGPVTQLPHALVFPSARTSTRTPFGTGRVVHATLDVGSPFSRLHSPRCYDSVRRWLDAVKHCCHASPTRLLQEANAIHPVLHDFLANEDFYGVWKNLLANHPDEMRRLRQFQVWFDGLKTIRLIHALRDAAYPDVHAQDALHWILSRHNQQTQPPFHADAWTSKRRMLFLLRKLCRVPEDAC